MAAEDLAGPQAVAALEKAAEQAVPGLADEPAWPALRARLLLLGASGIDPIAQLLSVVDTRELDSAVDRAAVVGWRLDDTGYPGTSARCPGYPRFPNSSSNIRCGVAIWPPEQRPSASWPTRVRASVGAQQRPAWAGPGGGQPPAQVVEDIEVWRAAMAVGPDDRRPTGPVQRHKAARMWQRRLDEAVACSFAPAWREWRPLVEQLAPSVTKDSFAPILAGRLAAISDAGVDAGQLLRSAADGKPLPDDHAAAALWWRICRHLNPALLTRVNRDATVTAAWESRLAELIGAEPAETVQASPWWPALVTAVDHGLQRGWPLEDLIRPSSSRPAAADVDQCQAMLWRIPVALDPEDERYNRTPAPGQMPCGTPARHSPLNVQQLPHPTQIQMSRRPPKPASLTQRMATTTSNQTWRLPRCSVTWLGLLSRPTPTSTACSPERWPGGNAPSARNAWSRSTSSASPTSAATFPHHGRSIIWPTGSAQTSATTSGSSPVTHPPAGPTSLIICGGTGSPIKK